MAQYKAVLGHDIYKGYKTPKDAAAVIKAKAFVIVTDSDRLVNPEPAHTFAKLMNAKTLTLTEGNGHLGIAFGAPPVLKAEVMAFLNGK